MKIPRCRATVSEEIAIGHWGKPGKAGCICRTSNQRPYSRSQETGVNRPHSTPFACQRRSACGFFVFSLVFVVLVAAASAAELKIKVVDPQSAAVAGAQVELFHGDSSTPAAIQTTSPDGLVIFRGLESGTFRVRILAAGFADTNNRCFGFRFRSEYRQASPGAGGGNRDRERHSNPGSNQRGRRRR